MQALHGCRSQVTGMYLHLKPTCSHAGPSTASEDEHTVSPGFALYHPRALSGEDTFLGHPESCHYCSLCPSFLPGIPQFCDTRGKPL